MSVMLTLISTRPIFCSSGSSEVLDVFAGTCSRSRLMSSIRIEAIDLAQLAEDDVLGLLLDLPRCSGPAGGWRRSA